MMGESIEPHRDLRPSASSPDNRPTSAFALGPDHIDVTLRGRFAPSKDGKFLNEGTNATLDAAREAEVLARAQQGEEQAFEALFYAYRRRVYSLCVRMTRSAVEAEDLTQEAFLKVFRKISTFRGDSTFSTWLHRIVINAVLTYLRHKRCEPGLVGEVDSGEKQVGPGPFRRQRSVEQQTDDVALHEAIASLPPHHRAVFVLHEVEGHEHREIARMVDCSIARSRSLLHDARLRLRKRLTRERRRGPASQCLEPTF
jgi:RNA polymerase sigma-70 factor (ECF subfamily)